jgi:protein gp37
MLGRPDEWKTPRRIFVNSMSDLFHAGVPDEYIDLIFGRMEATNRHVYQLLTKRPERMRRYIKKRYHGQQAPSQIWLGVSVENNEYAWRANMLRDIPASVRFLSVEPMLGPVDEVDLDRISWVIVGGESGPRHRSMEISWIREIRNRCEQSGIAFFFKQWHKGNTGRLLDGRTWDALPATASAEY